MNIAAGRTKHIARQPVFTHNPYLLRVTLISGCQIRVKIKIHISQHRPSPYTPYTGNYQNILTARQSKYYNGIKYPYQQTITMTHVVLLQNNLKIYFFILTNTNMSATVFYIRQAKTYPGNKGMDDKKIATVFKALCDENRVKIIRALQNGEKCACKLLQEINVSQPTLSHHMKILCDSGIVSGRKEGKWTHYSISPQGAMLAKEYLNSITELYQKK